MINAENQELEDFIQDWHGDEKSHQESPGFWSVSFSIYHSSS